MKHDFHECRTGDDGERILAWLEDETVQLLRRSYGDREATKGAIFLFAHRAYEAHLPETAICDLFGRCIARAGFPPEDDDAMFSWFEQAGQIAAQMHRDGGGETGGAQQ